MIINTMPNQKWLESAGTTMELLWENASPTSEFAAQTISLDLSQFFAVIIRSVYHIGGNMEVDNIQNFVFCLKGKTSIVNGCYATAGYRIFTVNEDGIVFNEGKGFLTYGSINASVNNKYYAPIAIYGIKGLTT